MAIKHLFEIVFQLFSCPHSSNLGYTCTNTWHSEKKPGQEEKPYLCYSAAKTYPGLQEFWTGSQNIVATLDTWDVDITGGGDECHSATQLVQILTTFWGRLLNGCKCAYMCLEVYILTAPAGSLLNKPFKILLLLWQLFIRTSNHASWIFVNIHLFCEHHEQFCLYFGHKLCLHKTGEDKVWHLRLTTPWGQLLPLKFPLFQNYANCGDAKKQLQTLDTIFCHKCIVHTHIEAECK